MNLSTYQKAAQHTCSEQCDNLTYLILGLTSEAGEVADKYKKHLRGDKPIIDKEALAHELGDVLWYVSQIARQIGYELNEIGHLNLMKLASRQKRGVIGGDGDGR